MAKRLKQFYEENPQKPSGQGSFLDREDIKDLIDEALEDKGWYSSNNSCSMANSEMPDIGRNIILWDKDCASCQEIS